MIHLDTIKLCCSDTIYFPDVDKQVITGAGYNAIIETVMTRQQSFPCVILEEQDSGVLSIQPGGFDKYPQSLWILDRCASDENPELYYIKTKQILKDLISSILRHRDEHQDLVSIDFTRMPYMKRQGGNELYGWEIILTTEEDVDLSAERQSMESWNDRWEDEKIWNS